MELDFHRRQFYRRVPERSIRTQFVCIRWPALRYQYRNILSYFRRRKHCAIWGLEDSPMKNPIFLLSLLLVGCASGSPDTANSFDGHNFPTVGQTKAQV